MFAHMSTDKHPLAWELNQLHRGLLPKDHPRYEETVRAEAERKAAYLAAGVGKQAKPRSPLRTTSDAVKAAAPKRRPAEVQDLVDAKSPPSHPDCARCNANREATRERMRKKRKSG